MDNRRLLIAALLSAAVLILWNIVFPPPRPVRAPADQEVLDQQDLDQQNLDQQGLEQEELGRESDKQSTGPPALGAIDPSLARSADEDQGERPELVESRIEGEREERLELDTAHGVAVISNLGGQLVSFETRAPQEGSATDGVEMVRQRPRGEPYLFGWVDSLGNELELNRVLFEVVSSNKAQVELEYRGPAGEARKSFVVNDLGQLEVQATASPSGWGLLVGPGVRNPELSTLEDKYLRHGSLIARDGDADLIDAQKVHVVKEENGTDVDWVSLEDTYFLTAVAPRLPLVRANLIPGTVTRPDADGPYSFAPLPADATKEQKEGPRDFVMVLEPGPTGFSGVTYLGAKDYAELKAYGIGLEKSIRWPKYFRPLTRPLQIALNWLYENVRHNYGWCIILMTVLIKLVLFPLTHKSYTSMQKMQQLNPRMEAIRKKYRPKLKDKQGKPNLEQQRKMNEEIQSLFRSEGVNPAGSCLPMLVQMPIFLSFFYLLRGAPELWHAPWIGWIHDLSAPDPIHVLPVLMGITQFLSTRMMPAPPNPTQRIIMNTFPLWFAFIAIGFPAGLVVYWLTNNILTIIQQGGYNRLKKAGIVGGGSDAKVQGKPA